MVSTIKNTILAASIGLISFNAQATLTSYNANGVDLVYSSVSDVTWTKDGDLFQTMYKADNTLIDKIIAVTPSIYDSYYGADWTLGNKDFYPTYGAANFYGAVAFVNYLNSIKYAGNNTWRLPTVASASTYGYNTPRNGTATGDELTELFYDELHGKAGSPIPDTDFFDNEQARAYLYSTTYRPDVLSPEYIWHLVTWHGFQFHYGNKTDGYVIWAITSGTVANVPEPESLAMLFAGLGLLRLASRRNKQA